MLAFWSDQAYSVTVIIAAFLPSITRAEVNQDCPLLGPAYPAPSNVMQNATSVPQAVANLDSMLRIALENGSSADGNTSFYISVFSAEHEIFNFSHVTPTDSDALTTGKLDENTIFRVGSVSKLLTVYTMLAAVGTQYLSDPVTKWVSELARANVSDAVSDVQWDQITIGALASQMAGIARDRRFPQVYNAISVSLEDFSNLFNHSTLASDFRLPLLPTSEVPICGTSNVLPPCTRDAFFQGLETLHPVTAPFNTPIYSNLAFEVLAYALEDITNTSFSTLFKTSLLEPLNLTRTTLEPPVAADNAIIPGRDELLSWWNVTTGGASPFGGMFSTASDLTTIAQSILRSSLLSPALTRAWLKPVTHTADLHMSVGMPWEIYRLEIPVSGLKNGVPPQTRVVDVYTKNGDLGEYGAFLVLSPDHNFGFVMLFAGLSSSRLMSPLADFVALELIPAFEEAAREQAEAGFSGTYISNSSSDFSMNLTISADDGRTGLGVQQWWINGQGEEVDGLQHFGRLVGIDPRFFSASLRLYPMALASSSQASFRGIWQEFPLDNSSVGGGPFTTRCLAWAGVDTPQYGNIGFDDFVFDLDTNGKATAVTPRVLRRTFERVA